MGPRGCVHGYIISDTGCFKLWDGRVDEIGLRDPGGSLMEACRGFWNMKSEMMISEGVA